MKSRKSSAGILSPFTAIWRWFLAPRRNPHAAEDRANQRRRDKRKRATLSSGKVKATGKMDAGSKSTVSDTLAFVDKAGNVRLTDGGRIVARAGKGSKSAALQAARHLHEDHLQTLETLEGKLSEPAIDLAVLEQDVAGFKTAVREAPGLGDVPALEQRLEDLEAALDDRRQVQWNLKRDIIARLEALGSAPPSALPEAIVSLSSEWLGAGSAGAVHDTVLERRYAAALEAAEHRKHQLETQPELLELERQAVLDDLTDLMSTEDRTAMHPRLTTLREAWQQAGGPDDVILDEQFSKMAAAIAADVQALEEETTQARVELERDAAELESRMDALSQDTSALVDRSSLSTLAQAVAEAERRARGTSRDITDRLRRRIDELQWRADREIEHRRAQVVALAQEASQHLETALRLPRQSAETLKDWRTLEEATQSAMQGAEAVHGKLNDWGHIASKEATQISSGLREARKALSEARKAFFESLDESRETNGFRKRALLDRLRHAPVGASVKELDAHVEGVMADWKQVGSAGRDSDQSLWEEFQDIRTGIRGLRDEASHAERDDYSARLADAFARKRALTYTIEDEIRMGRLVLEQQKDPKFEKELRRKERRLEDLRKDLSDIQRKLSKLSKPRSGSNDAKNPTGTTAEPKDAIV